MKIIIIGGGIMGLSIALELKKTTAEVVVLERSVPGAEASSAAAGMLAPQLEDASGPMLELGLLSRMAWPKFAADLEQRSQVSVDYATSGGFAVAFTDAEVHALEARVAGQQAFSLRSELLTGDEARKREPRLSPQVLAVADAPDEHQVDPRKLMRALAVAATKAGVVFKNGTVRALLERGGAVTGVDVDGEHLKADLVVLAAGAWSGLVSGAGVDPARVKPVRGQMVELQLRAPIFTRLLKGSGGYVVPRSDGRVIAGSTMEMVGFDKNVTAGGLARVLNGAVQLVPALAEAAVIGHWSGLRPWTPTVPFLGPSGKQGLLLATGHARNGILLAPITARVIGQVVRGERPVIDLQPFRYLP